MIQQHVTDFQIKTLVKYILWIVSIAEKFSLILLTKGNQFLWFKVSRGKVAKHVCYFGPFSEVWMKKNYIFYLMNKIGFTVLEYIWRFTYSAMGTLARKKSFPRNKAFIVVCIFIIFKSAAYGYAPFFS